MKIIMAVIKVLVLAALLIVSNYNLPLSENDSRDKFYGLYTLWLREIFDKGVYITGDVAGVEWLPGGDNSTESIKAR